MVSNSHDSQTAHFRVSEQEVCLPTALKARVSQWEKKTDEHRQKQLINPFSEWQGACHREKLCKKDRRYGRPVEGSQTEARGVQANSLISSEIFTLLTNIRACGKQLKNPKHGICFAVTFGELFDIYTTISNKVVGLLLRARKHGMVDFEGEMLYQRRDEETVIYLLPSGLSALLQ